MKTLKIITATLLFVITAGAQAQVSVNVNIGTAPAWGPVGYTDVRYYYLPDVSMYYDINTTEYIYINNGHWVRTRTVPVAYRHYNFYNGYKVVLTDYRGASPYYYYKTHRIKYPRGYHPAAQRTIGHPPVHVARTAVAHPHHGTAVIVNNRHGYHGNGRGHGNARHAGHGGGHGHGRH